MSSTGYIDSAGVYHKVDKVPLEKVVKTRQSMYQQGDFAKQRFDHASEIVQPYTVDGKPNDKFIEAFPEDAAQYGLIPKTDPEPERRTSDTPRPGEEGYGGSTPWEHTLNQRLG